MQAMQAMQATAMLCLLLAAVCLGDAAGGLDSAASLIGERAAAVGEAAEARADAEASADPGTGGTNNFFDTFMSFLGSSALHQHQPADEEAAASEQQQQQSVEQGRSLYGGDLAGLGGSPVQDGGQADRVKRTGQIPAQILSGVINHKLGYLGAKSSHHIHFHNYNKCEKPHFSLWEFKKAILHKVLEAAKAIGGGVLALKGKLITAKGHLVAAKGRKLATKGEELTEFGKSILAKALGHGGGEAEVHTAPSAPSAPSAHYSAPVYGVPAPAAAFGGFQSQGYQYAAPQYLPPQPVPSGHGYNTAVSLLNEYSRAGFGSPAAPATHSAHASAHASGHHRGPPHLTQRTGQAPSGPSAIGPAGTLPGHLQAGLLVLQAAPSAPGRSGSVGAASFQHPAVLPAPSAPSAPAASDTVAMLMSEMSSASRSPSQQPLVLAPEVIEAMSGSETNKVRRYATPSSSRRSLDAAMAAVVQRLQGADVSLHSGVMRSAATRLVTA